MSREKQIEEIKKVLIRTCKRVRTYQEDYMQDRYAESLYKAGYRKAPEFAAEIFAEIMQAIEKGVAEAQEKVNRNTYLINLLSSAGKMYAGHIGAAIVEVFKKYAEGAEGKRGGESNVCRP